jgi:hypothetical protein
MFGPANAHLYLQTLKPDGSTYRFRDILAAWAKSNYTTETLRIPSMDPKIEAWLMEPNNTSAHRFYDLVEVVENKDAFQLIPLGAWSINRNPGYLAREYPKIKPGVRCLVVSYRFDKTGVEFFSLNPFHPKFIGKGMAGIDFLNDLFESESRKQRTPDFPWVSENLLLAILNSGDGEGWEGEHKNHLNTGHTFDFYRFFDEKRQVEFQHLLTGSVHFPADLEMAYATGNYLLGEENLEWRPLDWEKDSGLEVEWEVLAEEKDLDEEEPLTEEEVTALEREIYYRANYQLNLDGTSYLPSESIPYHKDGTRNIPKERE